jgi:hypothetical protein
MDQYREALLQFNTSGNVLDESDLSSFHEHIKKNECKYYFVLEPVLKDVPNMTPAWTNHAGTQKKKCGNSRNSASSDNSDATTDSSTLSNRLESSFCEVIERNSSTTRRVLNKSVPRQERMTSYASNESEYSKNDMERTNMQTNDNDCSHVSSLSNDKGYTSNDKSNSKRSSKYRKKAKKNVEVKRYIHISNIIFHFSCTSKKCTEELVQRQEEAIFLVQIRIKVQTGIQQKTNTMITFKTVIIPS